MQLDIELAPDARTVCADLNVVRQVLTNLLENSLRYTPPGGRIACLSRRDGEGVAVMVRDNGIGITSEQIKRIFERFFHVGDGTGLGLPIARWIAGAHHGALTLDRGPGTVFVLRMPPFEGAVSPGG